jgi:hypothetical protein
LGGRQRHGMLAGHRHHCCTVADRHPAPYPERDKRTRSRYSG